MTKIRLKQIEKMKLVQGDLKQGSILSYDGQNFTNKYFVGDSADSGRFSIPVRDSNGNIRVGDAENDNDAVNLKTVTEIISGIDLSSILNPSIHTNIGVIEDPDTGDKSLEVYPDGVTGGIQKAGKRSTTDTKNVLMPCSYIYEDTSKGSIQITRRSSYKGSSSYNSLLVISHVKSTQPTSDFDPELSFLVSTTDLNEGCVITSSVAKQSNANSQSIAKTAVENGQSLFRLTVNGYSSETSLSEGFRFEVSSASNYSDEVSSVFALKQNISGLLTDVVSSDKSGNIYLLKSVVIGNSDIERQGAIKFNGTHFVGYNGSEWLSLDVQSSNAVYMTRSVDVTINLGGYSAGDVISEGDTLEDIVEKLLSPYIQPSFDEISVVGEVSGDEHVDDVIECGTSFVPTYMEIIPVYGSDGNPLSNCVVNGPGFVDAQVDFDGSPVVVQSNQYESIVYDEPTTVEWVVTGTDSNGNQVSGSYKMDWLDVVWFGTSDNAQLQNISVLEQYDLIVDQSFSFHCTSQNADTEKYTYLAIPKAFVDNYPRDMIIRKNCLNVTQAFTRTEVSYFSSSGNTIPYYLYRSNAPGAFASGNSIRVK